MYWFFMTQNGYDSTDMPLIKRNYADKVHVESLPLGFI